MGLEVILPNGCVMMPGGKYRKDTWGYSLLHLFQSCALGAYITGADALKTREDAKKTALFGVLVNGGLLWLATVGVLAHYPTILPEKVPVLLVASHGGVGSWSWTGFFTGLPGGYIDWRKPYLWRGKKDRRLVGQDPW